MSLKLIDQIQQFGLEFRNFFAPNDALRIPQRVSHTKKVAILIPTHNPTHLTHELIESLLTFYSKALIIIIDDATPLNKKTLNSINKIKNIAATSKNVIYLRTPINALKAGALNFGIEYLKNLEEKPQVVFTLDDDVKITENTLYNMTDALYSESKIGAVCSQVRVKNKNKNLLTRLQSLEYHNFNITKISDSGFLQGPLVMQGMLTAFRFSALQDVDGFTNGHLIEDYDATVRLKNKGWKVRIAPSAVAWTVAPDTIEKFWKQRVRWTSGGIHVLQQFWKNVPSVYQDLLGHGIFFSLTLLVILSLLLKGDHPGNPIIALLILALAIISFIVSFAFNLYTLTVYPERDKKDTLIKLAIIPEFIYSNVLSFILLGSYLFVAFNIFANLVAPKGRFHKLGLSAFKKAGYSSTWGTK